MRHVRAGGPRSIVLARGAAPQTNFLDVLDKTPVRQMSAAGGGMRRNRLSVTGSGEERSGRRELGCEARSHHHPGRARFGPVLFPIVAASGKTPITTLGKTAAQRLSRDGEGCRQHLERAAGTGKSRIRHGCTLSESLPRPDNPRPSKYWASRLDRPLLARPTAAAVQLNWNVGLDYTAHRTNCQSANTFVDPRQTRAPRLRKAPSNTDPRPPSQPLASRASSRPRSAPSTMA